VRPARRRGAGRALTLAAVAVGAAVGLGACSGSGGGDLARRACVHVERSVRAWEQSARPGTTPADAARLQRQAADELRSALPLAAAATSDDGSWNSLMTTISEGGTVDESHLIPALRGECVVANANPNVNPQNPGSPQPPDTANVNPQSPGG
jgi:hypothetical protein